FRDFFRDNIFIRVQYVRVQISLYSYAFWQSLFYVFNIRIPINRNHVRFGFYHQWRKYRSSFGKGNNRHCTLDVFDDIFVVLVRKFFVIIPRQDIGPAVEQLQGIDTRIYLHIEVRNSDIRYFLEDTMSQLGLVVEHKLCFLEIFRRTAFYEITKNGERSTRKTDQGNTSLQALLDNFNRVG